MSKRQLSLFDGARLTLEQSIELTQQSLLVYAQMYHHWAIAYSGGKDSSALLTVVLWMIQQGMIPTPETLTVLYSDTRMELPPLQIGAIQTLKRVRELGYRAQIVVPEMDRRFMVYLLGRGVPPPNNQTLRWCTPQIKVAPMLQALDELKIEHGEKFLMLTGVRIGESAARDARIALSCNRNGGECGQGWFQETMPEGLADTLAPLLHWRVCHVWDWLMFHAPAIAPSVAMVARVYGGEDAEEINARTGCVGCPLATKDTAMDYVLRLPEWAYLQPMKRMRGIYRELRSFSRRKQKDGERLADGRFSSAPSRKGPLMLDARLWGLEQVLEVQRDINAHAILQHRPQVYLIDGSEEARIRELISLRTYPHKWSDDDPDASVLIPQTYQNGDVQSILPLFR